MCIGDQPNVIYIEVTFFAKTLESPKDTDIFLVAEEYEKAKILMDLIRTNCICRWNRLLPMHLQSIFVLPCAQCHRRLHRHGLSFASGKRQLAQQE